MNSRISDWRGVMGGDACGGDADEGVAISNLLGEALLSMYTVLREIARGWFRIGKSARTCTCSSCVCWTRLFGEAQDLSNGIRRPGYQSKHSDKRYSLGASFRNVAIHHQGRSDSHRCRCHFGNRKAELCLGGLVGFTAAHFAPRVRLALS